MVVDFSLKPNWLWICFPGRREWKRYLSIKYSRCVASNPFGYAFPFGGNGNNRSQRSIAVDVREAFGYAFPFGGNGNKSYPQPWDCLAPFPLDMLSRSEGMETRYGPIRSIIHDILFSLDMLSRSEGMETHHHRLPTQWFQELWICFPGRREWKQDTIFLFVKVSCLLWICFPGRREWKPA